jgi:hypothetical protein
LFPVDCVSHAAVGMIKRICRNGGKRYLPLRSSGLSSFVAALSGLGSLEPERVSAPCC